jgi:hypothetical protein
MPEGNKTGQKPADTKTALATRTLKSAAASGDPAVHQLLAERQTAQSNGDDDAVLDVDRRLADLGFE